MLERQLLKKQLKRKFKKDKKLYARAKAIVVKGGETYQGKWSKPKQVKIKK